MLARSESTHDLPSRPQEFMGNLLLLIAGGNDTTRNSISGGLWFLNQFPEEYAKLRTDPELIPKMAPEIIRYQSPVVHMRRIALCDAELNGKRTRKGDKVAMWYISGNRDPDELEEPDRFIIDRPQPRHHLSFGFGIHRCVGNRLAEKQAAILGRDPEAFSSDRGRREAQTRLFQPHSWHHRDERPDTEVRHYRFASLPVHLRRVARLRSFAEDMPPILAEFRG
jgi:hypothetical protein